MATTTYAPSFDQSIRDLADHPVINTMAAELLAAPSDVLADLTNADGGPTSVFSEAASAEFFRQTGQHGRFLGTVAHAVLRRLNTLLAEINAILIAALPDEASEAWAAELEARQAVKDFWKYGSPRCALTRYAESAGKLADRLAADGG
ncbi:hypothetical protein OHS33_39125 (plasmid) [Streptomyces sp. NBC_00536]|uniref:hypothetical protein n=1 Tax=Streptomyces sp. NBC_00536 TaxID=2975769 RepID=UPI002E81C69B|nr:hypothetical protein [Streptomyces sp. NBC_00536]WUC84372.1 hypothetical protein OHS33_39125 [Streptomyces sp. NBC_00536]